jgi:hypothetical protein
MFNLTSSQNSNQSFSHLRIMKGNSMDYFLLKILSLDLCDLDTLPSTCQVTQPDLSDVSHLNVTISPDDVNIKQTKKFIQKNFIRIF